MTSYPRFSSHLRVALTAALVLALCQVVAETVMIAARFRPYLLIPFPFFQARTYDACVKLVLLLPGAREWLIGTTLDQFLPLGFRAKLALAGALVGPNVLIAGFFGLLIAAARCRLRRPARPRPVILGLAACGLATHVALWLTGLDLPLAADTSALRAGFDHAYFGSVETLNAIIALALATLAAWVIAGMKSMTRSVAVLGIAAALGIIAYTTPAIIAENAPPAATSSAPPGRRLVDNVILISIDSLRADRLGCYGNAHATSPAIDALARQGVRFTDAMSTSSWTLPSHMSLLTGLDVLSHGVVSEADHLPADVPTLAAMLQSAGIHTDGIVAEGLLGSWRGFGRGFDSYDDTTAVSQLRTMNEETAPVITRLAIDRIRAHRDERFFLFLHFWDVHYDYAPPAPYDTMFDPDYRGPITGAHFIDDDSINEHLPRRDLEHLLALYDGEVRWIDEHIARILTVIDELGIADRTAIIVTADHGDEFFEHRSKGHGITLYREVMQIPLVIRAPGVTPGQVVDAPVSLTDVAPTVLELLGIGPRTGGSGVSLIGAARGKALADRGPIYGVRCLGAQPGCRAMQHSTHGTLIHSFWPFGIEFYAPEDRTQHRDLATSSEWPRAQQLSLMTSSFNRQWGHYRSVGGHRGTAAVDEATRERLRQLGYE